MFPVQKLRYLAFTGEMIGAADAYRYGAIERVVPREQLRDAAWEIAAKIATKSPYMLKLTKESLTGVGDRELEDQYRWEQGFTLQAYLSPDSIEARKAFVEKREAKF
jgi:enoyl-CoA hydratase